MHGAPIREETRSLRHVDQGFSSWIGRDASLAPSPRTSNNKRVTGAPAKIRAILARLQEKLEWTIDEALNRSLNEWSAQAAELQIFQADAKN